MEDVTKKLSDIEQRLARVETRLGISATATEIARSQMPQQTSPPPPPSYVVGTMQEAPRRTGVLDILDSLRPRKDKNMESAIGQWWLGIAGVVAILFGVSFFLKYAFENNLIGETGRIILGLLGATTLVVLGEIARKKYPKYSFILSGGGLGLYYLSVYGAFWYYHFIGQETTFFFMCMVTAFGVLLALWSDGMELAMIALAGGLLTPYLVSTAVPADMTFFSYLVILNAGVLAIALFRKWHPLSLIGFIGTVLNFSGWYAAHYGPDKLLFTVGILTIFWALYVFIMAASNLVAKKQSDLGDLFILTINPVWFFGWIYWLLNNGVYEDALGFIAAALAAVYIAFASAALRLRSDDRRLPLFLGGIAVGFLTIAIPLELEGNAITIGWAAEAALLIWTGVRMKEKYLYAAGATVYAIALFRLIGLESRIERIIDYTPIFNARFLAYAASILSAASSWYWMKSAVAAIDETQRRLPFLFGGAALILFLILGTLEIDSFFDKRVYALEEEVRRQESLRPSTMIRDRFGRQIPQYRPPPQMQLAGDTKYHSLMNQANAGISVFWALYATALITIGILRTARNLRWAALGLFGITIFKVFLIDLANLQTLYRIISFIGLGVVLLLASYLYFRFEQKLIAKERGLDAPV
ncbi:MAG: DUF2339 domain-containing protein [Patescibacteria group bacterium]